MENIFKNYVIENELFVGTEEWNKITYNYTEEVIIKELSDAVVLFDIRLPYRKISLEEATNDYQALKAQNSFDLVKFDKWGSKFGYEYPFLDEYIDLSNVGNKSSDYFHQIERWKCDATGYPSPQKTWETERFRLTLFKALFSLKVKEINPQILRTIISLRKYIAAQFRPSAAKAIYDMFCAKSVLDFSMGWGDRIAGAFASDWVERYVGIDPNSNLILGYVEQIKFYKSIDKKKMSLKLYPDCAENEQLWIDEEFDLIFTSPPYFDKEKYDQSDIQSYKKYKGFDVWMKEFLFKTIEIRGKNLKRGGHLVINISDIYTRKKLYKICDGMNDYIISTGEYDYIGAIGLRMPKRPMSISSDTAGIYGEPVWIYRKK